MTEHALDARPLPENMHAEAALLGAVMEMPGAYEDVRTWLRDDDFFRPAHANIWAVICSLADNGTAPKPMVVMTELRKRKELEAVGGAAYLFQLVQLIGAGSPRWLAERVHETAQARRLIALSQRLAQAAYELSDDYDRMLEVAASTFIAGEVLVDEKMGDEPLADLESWEALWRTTPSLEVNWLVHELLLPGDVWFVLGSEGGGKSYLSRQFCLCLAAGVHPFRPSIMLDPLRTLMIDLENDRDMLAYESRMIGQRVAGIAPIDHSRAKLWHHPRGLNLRDRKDQVLFERHIAEAEPQFVAMGSLFKAFRRGRDDWDTAAEEVRDFLDTMRTRYHFCLMVEHHMPKGTGGEREKKPYGAVTWQQWPSLGHAIHRVGNNAWALTPYRGTRLTRDLPLGLHRTGDLPWSPIYDAEELKAVTWDRKQRKDVLELGL